MLNGFALSNPTLTTLENFGIDNWFILYMKEQLLPKRSSKNLEIPDPEIYYSDHPSNSPCLAKNASDVQFVSGQISAFIWNNFQ